jgi:hypothetical protein
MRKLLTFLIALAGIVLGVCSPSSAQGFNGGGFNIGLGPFASGGGAPIVAPVMMAGPSSIGPSISAINYIGFLGGISITAWSTATTRVNVWPIAGTLSGLTVSYPAGGRGSGDLRHFAKAERL